jgi:uncharacterized metal-binding protein
MPNGKAHASATILLAAGLGFISISLRDDTALTTAAVVGGCLAGLVLTPDLDVDRGSISHRIVKRSAGFLIGFAWHLFWFPYSRIMPHRSWWSHMPLFSTFFRVVIPVCTARTAVGIGGYHHRPARCGCPPGIGCQLPSSG